jgi:hypothetical protein
VTNLHLIAKEMCDVGEFTILWSSLVCLLHLRSSQHTEIKVNLTERRQLIEDVENDAAPQMVHDKE